MPIGPIEREIDIPVEIDADPPAKAPADAPEGPHDEFIKPGGIPPPDAPPIDNLPPNFTLAAPNMTGGNRNTVSLLENAAKGNPSLKEVAGNIGFMRNGHTFDSTQDTALQGLHHYLTGLPDSHPDLNKGTLYIKMAGEKGEGTKLTVKQFRDLLGKRLSPTQIEAKKEGFDISSPASITAEKQGSAITANGDADAMKQLRLAKDRNAAQLQKATDQVLALSVDALDKQTSLEKMAQYHSSELDRLNRKLEMLAHAQNKAESALANQLNKRGIIKRLFHRVFGESRSIKDARAQLASRTTEIQNHQSRMKEVMEIQDEQISAKRKEFEAASKQLDAAKQQKQMLEMEDKRLADAITTGRLPPQIIVPEEPISAKAKPVLTNDQAARTIQGAMGAFAKGQQTRRETVLPGQIREYLQSSLGGFKVVDDYGKEMEMDKQTLDSLSKALAREVVSSASNPKAYSGEGQKLVRGGQLYAFPEYDKQGNYLGKRTIKLPVDVWARRSKDGSSIEFEIVGKKLGSGSFKDVYQSRPLTIDMQTVQHDMDMEKAVLLKAKPGQTELVLGGMDAINKNFTAKELADPEFRVAGILTRTERVAQGSLEARDVEYAGDFEGQNGKMTTADRFRAISDVATTLGKFHNKGIVHADIKPANILIGHDRRGYISDHDFVKEQGYIGYREGSPLYMDALSHQGYPTPLTDIYAMAETSSEILFGIVIDATLPNPPTVSDFISAANRKITRTLAKDLGPFGISSAQLKGQTPEEALRTINSRLDKNLAPDQKITVAKILGQAKALIQARDNIAGVFEANTKTVSYLANSLSTQQLLKGTSSQRKQGVAQLYQQFPAYKNFLGNMEKINRTLQAS